MIRVVDGVGGRKGRWFGLGLAHGVRFAKRFGGSRMLLEPPRHPTVTFQRSCVFVHHRRHVHFPFDETNVTVALAVFLLMRGEKGLRDVGKL